MYKRILVPLDGSRLAEQTLPYVRLLAGKLSLPVELLRVIDHVPPTLADPEHKRYLDQVALSLQNEAADYLGGVAASLEEAGLKVSTSVHEGGHASDVASYIVSEAESQPETLIAMSTHGRSGPSRWMLGSISDKVLHAATVPLFLVHSRKDEEAVAEPKLETVLAPLDGSPLAEGILDHVVAVAEPLGLKVVLLNVTPPTYTALMAEGAAAVAVDVRQEPSEATLDYLGGIEARLRAKGIAEVETKALWGPPADVILDAALEMRNGLVAMSTHGRSGVGRWLMGSIADRVVRYAGVPVLVSRSSG
ncbi:MAG: universal stress protein [Dehalococcoidia bacterium]